MTLRRPSKRRQSEPTIALINIVFLLLVFFMIAGALAPPLDQGISLVNAEDLEGRAPPDAAVVFPDGRMTYQGIEVDVAGYLSQLGKAGEDGVRIVPDRDLPAKFLTRLVGELRDAGAAKVWLVTEKGLQ